MKQALLVVAKRPVPGKTKTRLTPPLDAPEAAQFYECMLLDTLEIMRAVPDVALMLAFSPPEECEYFAKIAPDFSLIAQIGGGLGERLDNALSACLVDGFGRPVIMDSDSPNLPVGYLARAFKELEAADVVLGPTEDGGYYLIGMNRPQSRLLRQVQMSTARVALDTLALARKDHLQVSLLPPWFDVDTESDLQRLRKELRGADNGTARHTREFLEK